MVGFGGDTSAYVHAVLGTFGVWYSKLIYTHICIVVLHLVPFAALVMISVVLIFVCWENTSLPWVLHLFAALKYFSGLYRLNSDVIANFESTSLSFCLFPIYWHHHLNLLICQHSKMHLLNLMILELVSSLGLPKLLSAFERIYFNF